MFAVVKTGGRQFKVDLGTKFNVEKLDGEVGDKVELDVLLAGAEGKVFAEIIKQGKGDKVLVFKKRRRHMYRRKNGHRQSLTGLQIVELGGQKFEQKKSAKTSKPVEQIETDTANETPKAAKKAAAKTIDTPEKKPAAKKPAAKKENSKANKSE